MPICMLRGVSAGPGRRNPGGSRRLPGGTGRRAAVGVHLHTVLRALAVTAILPGAGLPAAAQTRLEAHYQARLSILPFNFATATLKVGLVERGRYQVDLSSTGWGFAISAKSLGSLGASEVSPASAAIDTRGSNDKRAIRMALARNTVRMASVIPPLQFRPDRVPVRDEHRRGVIDPVSALLMPTGDGDPLSPGKCDRTLQIFEGTERFDLRLSYLRTEQVRTRRGYRGPVLVCRASYRAVAGHRPRKQVEFMEHNRDIEVWLAPIGGLKVLVPWKVTVGTMVGMLTIEATEFTVGTGPGADARAPGAE